jgi:hypothetical protein
MEKGLNVHKNNAKGNYPLKLTHFLQHFLKYHFKKCKLSAFMDLLISKFVQDNVYKDFNK